MGDEVRVSLNQYAAVGRAQLAHHRLGAAAFGRKVNLGF
jgi:hypothetical protein